MDQKKLKAIVHILDGTDITLLEWRKGDERWTIRRGSAHEHATVIQQAAPAPAVAAAAPPAAAPPLAEAAPKAAAASSGRTVASPFVGTFYRASSPEADPFVEVGDVVQKGQTLCIIEAMKLMNEIEAETSGRIAAVLAQNGQPVEYGEALFEIEPH